MMNDAYRHFEVSTESVEARGLRFAVAVSRYNAEVTEALLHGALAALREAGAREDDIHVARVPGAFELPLSLQAMLRANRYDAAIALGCVLRGGTPHFEYVCQAATHGLMRVGLDEGIPVGFGLLTVDTQEQALERARPDETNKGREAALTAAEMARLLRVL